MSPVAVEVQTATFTKMASVGCCLHCGSSVSMLHEYENAKRRIAELEAQVKILSDKATSAVDKLADYEDGIQSLKKSSTGSPTTELPPRPTSSSSNASMSRPQTTANRISAFLSAATIRRTAPPSPPPPAETFNLELERERSLRLRAEERLKDVTAELEDLTSSLFQNANEMVAEERKARHKLEERVAFLEKRDVEKRERLGLLERAVDRMNRVREVLAANGSVGEG
ncbi:hypothetical protein RUND412_002045 [Rhizina undulata]